MSGIMDTITSTLIADGHSFEYASQSAASFDRELRAKPYERLSCCDNGTARRRSLPARGNLGVAGTYCCMHFRA